MANSLSNKMSRGIGRHLFLLLSIWFLTACGEQARIDEEIGRATTLAETKISRLREDLQSGAVRNAIVLQQYADYIAKNRPDLAPLARQLALDGTSEGPMFVDLERRLEDARNKEVFPDWQQQLQELQLLSEAADRPLYNDALSDPINVLADLSNGQLARVNAISREASMKANQAEDYGAGGRLVGNPHYGHWRTGSNGMSFWEWYGMYSLFNNVFSPPIYYRNWAYHRDYSYYHDYGRRQYSSYRTRQAQNTLEDRTRKTFGSKGQGFKSPYSKTRTGSSTLSRASTQAQSSSFKSQFAKSSYARTGSNFSKSGNTSNSQYSSNFKSGFSRSSRSSFGGK